MEKKQLFCNIYKYENKKAFVNFDFHKRLKLIIYISDLGGARTLDPLIKSQLLYQLSYGVS